VKLYHITGQDVYLQQVQVICILVDQVQLIFIIVFFFVVFVEIFIDEPKAQELYEWTRKTLWVDGRVNDHIDVPAPFPLDDRTFTCTEYALYHSSINLL
jgi:hypothetical protein